ncbi:MAG: hypothetical protein AB7R69_05450, partial [Candidatus Babeliales bacterium]
LLSFFAFSGFTKAQEDDEFNKVIDAIATQIFVAEKSNQADLTAWYQVMEPYHEIVDLFIEAPLLDKIIFLKIKDEQLSSSSLPGIISSCTIATPGALYFTGCYNGRSTLKQAGYVALGLTLGAVVGVACDAAYYATRAHSYTKRLVLAQAEYKKK